MHIVMPTDNVTVNIKLTLSLSYQQSNMPVSFYKFLYMTQY